MKDIESQQLFADARPDRLKPERAHKSGRAFWVAAAGAVVAAIAVVWWYYQRGAQLPEASPPQSAVSSAPASPAEPPSAAVAVMPAIRYPIEGVQPDQRPSLPALDQSDALMTQALVEMLGQRSVLSQLQTNGFVRRLVATVDSLPRRHAASRLWPTNPAPARFLVSRNADVEFIDADNGQRYTPFVLLLEQVDAKRAASVYASLYPLFQQAYEELGYPNEHFNDRLIEVIDHLLAAPDPQGPVAVRLLEVRGPVRMTRPWAHYEFVDRELEALSAGQKMMVRVGPVNEARLKGRLQALRAALVASPR